MSIQLAPRKNSGVKLSNITQSQQSRVSRVRRDLDQTYIEAETQARANFVGLKYINLYGFPIDKNHLIKLPKEIAQNIKMGIFGILNQVYNLATPEPGHPGQQELIDKLREQGNNPVVYLCSDISFEKLLNTYNQVMEVVEINDGISLSIDKMQSFGSNQNAMLELQKKLKKASVSDMVEIILGSAIQNKASDIHFEPERDKYVLRLRLDGVLHTFAELPTSNIKPVESRIKLLSGLKLNVDNIPQDGRFSFQNDGREIDVRVSMLPSSYGYSIVMRLLGTGNVELELSSLGFTGLAQERVNIALEKSQGMILNTGPTGSGKTTTLYTFLKSLNDGQSKIITLEDPIEYKLEGVSQTQIDTKAGYTFGSGLKSILRQDPDVVMIGEIRDKETAEIAVQASLTGHQVLSTIHTNDAAGAVPRLMEMGVKGFLIAESLSAVIGQRLVRRICQDCKTHYIPNEREKVRIIEALKAISDVAKVNLPQNLIFYTSPGCPSCNGLGYKGRVGVYEVLTVTDNLRDLLSDQYPSITQVRNSAMQAGMITMLQDGILKALDGLTDLKEVFENVG